MAERGSDKHTPRIDEEMERESAPLERGEPTQPRADGFRQSEGVATPEEAREEQDLPSLDIAGDGSGDRSDASEEGGPAPEELAGVDGDDGTP